MVILQLFFTRTNAIDLNGRIKRTSFVMCDDESVAKQGRVLKLYI